MGSADRPAASRSARAEFRAADSTSGAARCAASRSTECGMGALPFSRWSSSEVYRECCGHVVITTQLYYTIVCQAGPAEKERKTSAEMPFAATCAHLYITYAKL